MEVVAEAIGYIVYAVAAADKKVVPEEKQKAHDFLNENWKLLADDEDPFGVRALEFIEKMMSGLEDKNISSESAFDAFKEVFNSNPSLFTSEIKQFMLDLCIKTGSAFNQMNKSELVLLSRIEVVLKK